MLEIDETSRGVVERLRESIDYSATFTQEEIAFFLVQILQAWMRNRPGVTGRARAIETLEHAKEVLNAVH